jgi:lysophospholipase L1-like esterase
LANLGLIFPYSAAKTNNPPDYKSQYTGKWEAYKAVKKHSNCKLGVNGIAVCTNDSSASLTFRLRDNYPIKEYAFNHSKIFCNYPDSSYKIEIHPAGKVHKTDSEINIEFPGLTDSICIRVQKTNMDDSTHFRLNGLTLSNTIHSLTYHQAGVNGATAKSYLSCELFSKQLQTIDPDWVIISLGTNEAYNKHFSKDTFRRHISRLVHRIQSNTDSCWILLTTPGDAMYQKNKRNPNNQIVRQEIIKVARKMNCSYWDFFRVMGSKYSIDQWHSSDLTAKDKLHLNKDGYLLKGNLFFDAFLNRFKPFFNLKLQKE